MTNGVSKLNPTQAEILALAGEIASFAQQRCSDHETILVALDVAAKIVWRPSPLQLADRAFDSSAAAPL